jgi:hypothetical protein
MKEYICKEVSTDHGGYLEMVTDLIRCKDCKFFTDCGCLYTAGMVLPKENDFCSCAKLREDSKVRKETGK